MRVAGSGPDPIPLCLLFLPAGTFTDGRAHNGSIKPSESYQWRNHTPLRRPCILHGPTMSNDHLVAPTPSTSRSPYMSPLASTANSSATTLHEPAASKAHRLPPTLEAELARDERRFEEYGGDDPLPPTPKTPAAPISEKPVDKDANLVSWDGPDDPENPQNWSRFRKWVVTWTCVLLSINV